ncbi:MAG: hypothetical protein LBR33_07140 [Propionibacteriaceae bacterium]|jgi:hypothetical protein|nr:hypothetical protein [Propionibacteriaceae bacterium]
MGHVSVGPLLRRHHPRLRALEPRSPLQLGNGTFAIAIDPTGLQTFPGAYPGPGGFLLDSVAQWAWRNVEGEPPARLSLGRLGLDVPRGVTAADLQDIDQELDLSLGLAVSQFWLGESKFVVHTAVASQTDRVVTRVVRRGGHRTGLKLSFPGAGALTALTAQDAPSSWLIERRAGPAVYYVRVTAPGAALAQTGSHEFVISRTARPDDRPRWTDGLLPRATGWLEAVVEYAAAPPPAPADVDDCLVTAAVDWKAYWNEGGRIDLSESEDPQAEELERRLVLSHYLLRVNNTSVWPASNPGLLVAPGGQLHLETQVWHLAALAQWGHAGLLDQVLGWYEALLDGAREAAAARGHPGAYWPALTGPDGRPLATPLADLIWQQPQPVFLAELAWRARPTRETLARHAGVVFATAEYLAAYPGEADFSLGPPLVPAQATGLDRADRLSNPTFELTWWFWGLSTAADWADRLGEPDRAALWRAVAARLPQPQPRLGRYPVLLGDPWPPLNSGHPVHLAAHGLVPRTGLIDDKILEATLEDVLANWDWTGAAGWDYPLLAMTATRLHRPDLAVRCLLADAPENVYLANGHNVTASGPAHLAANGALLLAAGLMAAGWDGSEDAPGFGRGWTVNHERITRLP